MEGTFKAGAMLISKTLYDQHFHQFTFAEKLQTQTVSTLNKNIN
jgi:hypothetical protein